MKKNNKGITLIALAVTVVAAIILGTVGVTIGRDTINNTKYYRAVNNLKALQVKVNEMYQEYKEEGNANINDGAIIDEEPILSKAQTAYNTAKTNNRTEKNIGEFADYRYYSKDDITRKFGIDEITDSMLINVKSRTVILLNGIVKDGQTYYSLNEIENEQFNVEYIPL